MRICLGSRKAQAFTWLMIMVVLFAMGLIYIMLSQSFEKVVDITQVNATGTIYEGTYNKIGAIWDNWLIIGVACCLCFGILAAMRKRDDESPY